MNKKELTFTVTFVVSLSLLLFYLGTSITGNVIRFDGAQITTTIAPQSDINFYVLVTLIILFIGGYYFINRKKQNPKK